MKAQYIVTFPNHPEYNAEYELSLEKSGMPNFGNGTCLDVFSNGKRDEVIDTRYEKTITTDFYAWCDDYMMHKFDRNYNPVIARIIARF